MRNGSVVDLQIEAGRVKALVSGSSLYTVDIEISSLPKRKWTGIKARCAGQIGSLVELLQGSISQSVMEIVTCKGQGLFPSPAEITLECSCPDWATMCKHVAGGGEGGYEEARHQEGCREAGGGEGGLEEARSQEERLETDGCEGRHEEEGVRAVHGLC